MSTSRTVPSALAALLGVAALGVAPSVARAATYYVPNPDTGGQGSPKTQLEVSKGGSREVVQTFILTGRDGRDSTGGTANVDNDKKPNVFDVSGFIGGAGMLRLDTPDSLAVATGVLFLTRKTETLTWAAPVLSEDNWFEAGETAFVQNLARTPAGRSNLEILNFSPRSAVCSVLLRRPKGAAFEPPLTVPMLPLSHRVVVDPFNGLLGIPSAGGLRAEVSCDEPFYAYGTFLGKDAAAFRMLYPLDGPPAPVVETVSLDRPGTFFAPVLGASAAAFTLPLMPERGYRTVTIDFDVRISKFTSHFTGLVGMFRTGGPRFNKTLYLGTFVRGMRSRTLVDQGSAVVEPALKVATAWKEGAVHHVTLVYDTESATLRMTVARDGKVLSDSTGAAFNLDLADRGSPVVLNFGLPGVADGAYFPPIGWKFSDLKVRVSR